VKILDSRISRVSENMLKGCRDHN